ncbi:glutamine-hydrolyzing GMP synthase [Desulfovibrio sp. OttesenSCG-928-F20]|nr:glutamine-hydrolyzing GMP synthase [Desulfovibrio sp. OttesenSCG-928-M16]MDL2290852.1 glutamine-hydrolyzing GMP synthase [Desulfovibrio sp. OttesenSCG-928-F20]
MTAHSKVLIVDYGSQYTQLIARRVREAGVYSEILPCTASDAQIRAAAPSAIILSGGPDDVGAADAPDLSPAILEQGVPVLGICYGMQLLAHKLGGALTNSADREYGPARLSISGVCPLWEGLTEQDAFTVWMSHANTVTALPQGFTAIAATPAVDLAAMADEARKIYAVQFHPEVHHTQNGVRILHNFLFAIAGLKADWTMSSFVERAVEQCRAKVGAANVVLALSGGVDSTVVAAILHKAIGGQLHCIFVDHGLMRLGEAEEVTKMMRQHMPGLNLVHVQAQELFLGKLAGVEDPEQKRKIIGHSFIEVFDREAKKLPNVRFLAQGTIYPDVIESYSAKGVVIKSHHNVGGLPEEMQLDLIEPLRELFKDEVRALGVELGLPEDFIWRQPFPGPGLAVRILGEVTQERLDTLRAADHIVQQELKATGWYRKVWQGFAVLLPLRTVGVMGDARTYESVVALRVVNSVDAMTADWSRLPHEVLALLSGRIISEVKGVNRVVYDISSKPPSTIEWE